MGDLWQEVTVTPQIALSRNENRIQDPKRLFILLPYSKPTIFVQMKMHVTRIMVFANFRPRNQMGEIRKPIYSSISIKRVLNRLRFLWFSFRGYILLHYRDVSEEYAIVDFKAHQKHKCHMTIGAVAGLLQTVVPKGGVILYWLAPCVCSM